MSDYAKVPQALKDRRNWINWKFEVRSGKETKVPYCVHGGFAKTNDPTTWATFDEAAAAADVLNDNYDGIGFMLQGTSYVGIDFDGVVGDDGQPEPYVLEILKLLGNPYAEITPSGKGLRCFVECAALPAGQRKFSAGHYGCEIYIGNEGGRYLTATGNRFSGDGIPNIGDISLPYFLISQIRNDKFKKLWLGDLSAYGNDWSRADLALMGRLAREFKDSDDATLEKFFSASKLGQREKWIDREDYRKRTIAKARKNDLKPDPEFSEAVPTPASTQTNYSPIFRMGSEVHLKKIEWFWQDRIPLGKLTLFAGNPDNGKSLVSGWLAAACTVGRAFPDAPNPLPPSEVLMLLGEDDIDDTAAPRLKAADADMEKIHFLETMKSDTGSERGVRLNGADLQHIAQRLEQHPGIRLIVIDPISNYLGDTPMVAEQEIRDEVLVPLKKIAAEKNVSIIFIMHLNKKNDLDAIARVGGAMAFVGMSRASWLFVRDEKPIDEDGNKQKGPDTFSMLKIKNNLACSEKNGLSYTVKVVKGIIPDKPDEYVPFVDWLDKPVEHSADEALGTRRREPRGRPEGTGNKMQKALQFVADALQHGRQPSKTIIADAEGLEHLKKSTVQAAADKLGVKKYKDGKTYYWEMEPMNAVKAGAEPESELRSLDVAAD